MFMMETAFNLSLIVLVLYVIIQIINIFSLMYFENDKPLKDLGDEELPRISVLIAARNEEQNILRCLQSVAQLNYPSDKIQVLVGNDQSEDDTKMLIQNFIKDKHQFALVNITETLGKA